MASESYGLLRCQKCFFRSMGSPRGGIEATDVEEASKSFFSESLPCAVARGRAFPRVRTVAMVSSFLLLVPDDAKEVKTGRCCGSTLFPLGIITRDGSLYTHLLGLEILIATPRELSRLSRVHGMANTACRITFSGTGSLVPGRKQIDAYWSAHYLQLSVRPNPPGWVLPPTQH